MGDRVLGVCRRVFVNRGGGAEGEEGRDTEGVVFVPVGE